jgi:flagellar hook-length control protein FliK
MAEAFLGLLTESAPATAQAVASATSETATTESMTNKDQDDPDSQDADAAIALLMGLPVVPPAPPSPVSAGEVSVPGETAEMQTERAMPALQEVDTRLLPAISGQVAALAAGPSRPQPRMPESATAASMPALPVATPPHHMSEVPVEEATALPEVPRGVMESAARFRLDEATETSADGPLAFSVDASGDTTSIAAPIADSRPDQRPSDQALVSPHKQAASHLTKILADTGTQLATHGNRSELSLAPEELGRIKFDIRQHGDSLVVTLTADRPETLDLMRRHANDLRSELAAAGYGSATLDFAGSGDRRPAPNPAGTPAMFDPFPEPAPALPEPPLPAAFQRPVTTDGLDLRL